MGSVSYTHLDVYKRQVLEVFPTLSLYTNQLAALVRWNDRFRVHADTKLPQLVYINRSSITLTKPAGCRRYSAVGVAAL